MKVVIRADAYSELGTGHVMRCLAFGQGIKDNGDDVVFATYCESQGLLDRLKKEGFGIPALTAPGSLTKSLEIIDKEKPDWVVLDGYHFDVEFQKAVKDAGHRLLYIDDYAHLERYYADIILNQNYGSEKFHYNAEPDTKILAGTGYVLLRREFMDYAAFKRDIPEVAHKVLITLGGADPENNTLNIMKAVNLVTVPLEIKVVIGSGNPHYQSIRHEADSGSHNFEILQAVENMAPLMAWADISISAGGTTVWELAFMGLPSVLCIVAANQENTVNSLAGAGVFHSVGWIKEKKVHQLAEDIKGFINNKKLREVYSLKAKERIDGKGAVRVLKLMQSCISLKILFLGCNSARELADWLISIGEQVHYTDQRVDAEYVRKYNPDMILSYNYRHILKKDVIDIPSRGVINLHISYLPWNRGSQPNVWSFIENTPKGITIHYIDEGIDTGDILLQKEVVFDENIETLKSSYDKLHQEIRKLFLDNWDDLKAGLIQSRKQPSGGTLHFQKDAKLFEPFINERGWDVPVREVKNFMERVYS